MRLLLFDVDGTLIDGAGSGRRALELAFAEVFDLAQVPDVQGRVQFSGALDTHIHRDIAALLGINPQRLAAARVELLERYVFHLRQTSQEAGGGQVLPGVRELLADLAGRPGVRVGLLTGNIEAGARVKLEPHDLNHYFPTGGFGEDGPTRADVARVAWQRLEAMAVGLVPASRVVVLGDSSRDVACGRANGFRTLAVGTGWTPWDELAAAEPDHLVRDLSDTEDILARLGILPAAARQAVD
jgi:phosphoglycolate phosphatase-like HAD superfamily hydrolase